MSSFLSLLFHYSSVAVEGAQLGGEGVQVMEAAVVAGGGHAGHGVHLIEAPGGEDEEAAVGAGLEALALGLPIGADGLFLQMDEREALLYAFVFHH